MSENYKQHLSVCLIIGLLLMDTGISAQNHALRFYGHGSNDIDRVKIPIDNPHRKADVGGDFTIEFRMNATLAENPGGGSAIEGPNDDWTLGHVMVDRDIFGSGDYGDYGISLAAGRIAFGVNNGIDSYTLIGTVAVADGQWHAIAVTRTAATGAMKIFVDGISDAVLATGNVTGNLSYHDGRAIGGNGTWVNEPFIVLGAEKHDYDNAVYPSYTGLMDEFRISSIVRYTVSYSPVLRFDDDSYTMALFHFDEGSGTVLTDESTMTGTTTNGTLMVGGSYPSGPEWVFSGITWKGWLSSDWSEPGNWEPARVPGSVDDVVIGPGPFQPVVDTEPDEPAVCYSLYVMPGASLSINPGKVLFVNGEMVVY